jgi:ABC-type branched-subunit amino acid transport system substrate-binding protein
MAARSQSGVRCGLDIAAVLLIATCAATGCLSTSPKVVKIGFVAPFEGRYREIGDQVIPAARLAVRDYASRFPDNHLVIELVAYDDRGIPSLAVEQANKLISDPEVAVVVGHWRDETTQAALPVYEKAGIPLITFSLADLPAGGDVENWSPSLDDMQQLAVDWNKTQASPIGLMLDNGDDAADAAAVLTLSATHPAGNAAIGGPVWGLNQFHALAADSGITLYFVSGAAYPEDLSDDNWMPARVTDFVSGYEKSSLGAPPGLLSVTAYTVTWQAIEQAAAQAGIQSVMSAPGAATFDATGRRERAPIYLYRWVNGRPHLVKRLR